MLSGGLEAPGDRGRYLKFSERKILGRFLIPPENPGQPSKTFARLFQKAKMLPFLDSRLKGRTLDKIAEQFYHLAHA